MVRFTLPRSFVLLCLPSSILGMGLVEQFRGWLLRANQTATSTSTLKMVAWAHDELLPTLSIVDRDLFPERWTRCGLESLLENADMEPFSEQAVVGPDWLVSGELIKLQRAVKDKQCEPADWAPIHNQAMVYLSEAHSRFETAMAVAANQHPATHWATAQLVGRILRFWVEWFAYQHFTMPTTQGHPRPDEYLSWTNQAPAVNESMRAPAWQVDDPLEVGQIPLPNDVRDKVVGFFHTDVKTYDDGRFTLPQDRSKAWKTLLDVLRAGNIREHFWLLLHLKKKHSDVFEEPLYQLLEKQEWGETSWASLANDQTSPEKVLLWRVGQVVELDMFWCEWRFSLLCTDTEEWDAKDDWCKKKPWFHGANTHNPVCLNNPGESRVLLRLFTANKWVEHMKRGATIRKGVEGSKMTKVSKVRRLRDDFKDASPAEPKYIAPKLSLCEPDGSKKDVICPVRANVTTPCSATLGCKEVQLKQHVNAMGSLSDYDLFWAGLPQLSDRECEWIEDLNRDSRGHRFCYRSTLRTNVRTYHRHAKHHTRKRHSSVSKLFWFGTGSGLWHVNEDDRVACASGDHERSGWHSRLVQRAAPSMAGPSGTTAFYMAVGLLFKFPFDSDQARALRLASAAKLVGFSHHTLSEVRVGANPAFPKQKQFSVSEKGSLRDVYDDFLPDAPPQNAPKEWTGGEDFTRGVLRKMDTMFATEARVQHFRKTNLLYKQDVSRLLIGKQGPAHPSNEKLETLLEKLPEFAKHLRITCSKNYQKLGVVHKALLCDSLHAVNGPTDLKSSPIGMSYGGTEVSGERSPSCHMQTQTTLAVE